jgi:transposase
MEKEFPNLPVIPDSERTPLVDLLLEIIFSLREENRLLREESQLLREENRLLKERISKLEKNSSNSSKPPSSDITKPKSEQRQPGKRKIGGQAGHKGNWRRSFKPEEVDKVEHLEISHCPDCNISLDQLKDEVSIHQQAELVSKPVMVTEYRLQRGKCPCCDKTFTPCLPSGVIPNQLIGPRLIALYGYMKAGMGVSISEIMEFSKEVLKISISRGGVQKSIQRVSEALKPAYEELAKAVSEQESINVDETGWKENGKRRWIWLFCNSVMAYFVISKSRGCQVLYDVLGESFPGAITSDFYSAYIKYASPKQQFCLAHLIRELKFLTTVPDHNSKQFGMKLLAFMRRLFKLWHNKECFSEEEWQKKSRRFKSDLNRYLFSLKFDKKTDASRIQRRLIRHWENLFRFLEQPELFEPTNNLAERTLRPIVRLRRISQGSRGILGLEWTARAASVLATTRIQKISSWDFFLESVNARFIGSTIPVLLSRSS